MEIHIQKDTSVSLHEQLVVQISMQITSGVLAPGVKLPSIRGLAQKLGIHHNTCLGVYRELATIGLITLRHGSGAHVMNHPVSPKLAPLQQAGGLQMLAEFFIRQTHQHGYTYQQALEALQSAAGRLYQQTRQWVFVDLHADILPVFQAEFERRLNTGIRTLCLDDLQPEQERHSHFIVNRYHMQGLKERMKRVTEDDTQWESRMTVIDMGSGQAELALVRKLPPGSMLGLVSASSIILRQAEAVLRAVFGEELMVRTVLYGSEPLSEVAHVLKRSKVVLADYHCLPNLQKLSTRKVHPMEIIPSHEVDRLRHQLLEADQKTTPPNSMATAS